jgi:rhodanese-related sulfurtransferase
MEPGEFYGFKKPNTEEEIVFYCRSGKRSATACDSAIKNGYNK